MLVYQLAQTLTCVACNYIEYLTPLFFLEIPPDLDGPWLSSRFFGRMQYCPLLSTRPLFFTHVSLFNYSYTVTPLGDGFPPTLPCMMQRMYHSPRHYKVLIDSTSSLFSYIQLWTHFLLDSRYLFIY